MACVAAEAAWPRVCERFMRVAQAGGLPELFGELTVAEPLTRPMPAIPPERNGADAAAATDALPRAALASAPAPSPAPATPAATMPPAVTPVSDSRASAELRTTGDNAVCDPGTENTKAQ